MLVPDHSKRSAGYSLSLASNTKFTLGSAGMSSEHVYRLRTWGITRIHGALSTRLAAQLEEVLAGIAKRDESTIGRERLQQLGQWGAFHNLCDQDPIFSTLLQIPPVREVLSALMGSDLLLHSFDGLVMFPGEGRFPWDFHTDFPLHGFAYPACETPGINCLFYTSDVTEQNGATWAVVGSHHCFATSPRADDLARLSVQLTGDAGDVVLFDGRIWHCAGNNRTDYPRTVIKTLYCHSWQRPQMEFSRSTRQERLDVLPDYVRRLLGVGQSPPDGVDELRERLAKRRTDPTV